MTGGENAGIYADVQSMIIFSEEHYSVVGNFGERPDIPEGVVTRSPLPRRTIKVSRLVSFASWRTDY